MKKRSKGEQLFLYRKLEETVRGLFGKNGLFTLRQYHELNQIPQVRIDVKKKIKAMFKTCMKSQKDLDFIENIVKEGRDASVDFHKELRDKLPYFKAMVAEKMKGQGMPEQDIPQVVDKITIAISKEAAMLRNGDESATELIERLLAGMQISVEQAPPPREGNDQEKPRFNDN